MDIKDNLEEEIIEEVSEEEPRVKWEVVTSEQYASMDRLKVSGGYIYRCIFNTSQIKGVPNNFQMTTNFIKE